MSDEIDHSGTTVCVCPHCGFQDIDSSDLLVDGDASGTTNCTSCEKEFYWQADFEVTYNTSKLKE